MAEYGLSLSEALDIPSGIATDLLHSAIKRKTNEAEYLFIQAETLANLIQIKVSELLTGKPVKYDTPFKNKKPAKTTPLGDAQIAALSGMSKL